MICMSHGVLLSVNFASFSFVSQCKKKLCKRGRAAYTLYLHCSGDQRVDPINAGLLHDKTHPPSHVWMKRAPCETIRMMDTPDG